MYGFMIIFLIGLVFLAFGAYVLRRHSVAKHWPTVEGKLTALEYVIEYEGRFRVPYLVPKPVYVYSANALDYQGQTHCLDEKSGWIEERKVSKSSNFFCNVGDTVKVHYNPNKPADSVLQVALSPKRNSHYLAICVSGILLMAIGIVLAIWMN